MAANCLLIGISWNGKRSRGKGYNMNKCEMTIKGNSIFDDFYPCGKPAKYITPVSINNKKRIKVCGIHRRSVDKMLERTGQKVRCELITDIKDQ